MTYKVSWHVNDVTHIQMFYEPTRARDFHRRLMATEDLLRTKIYPKIEEDIEHERLPKTQTDTEHDCR